MRTEGIFGKAHTWYSQLHCVRTCPCSGNEYKAPGDDSGHLAHAYSVLGLLQPVALCHQPRPLLATAYYLLFSGKLGQVDVYYWWKAVFSPCRLFYIQ